MIKSDISRRKRKNVLFENWSIESGNNGGWMKSEKRLGIRIIEIDSLFSTEC